MKNIILLILAFLLAVASTIGVVFLFRMEFQTFEWGSGFGEFIASLFAFIFRIANIVNLFACAVCIFAWGMTLVLCGEVFGKETEENQSYTKYKKNSGTPNNSLEELIDMQGPENEDKSYLYKDLIEDCEEPEH